MPFAARCSSDPGTLPRLRAAPATPERRLRVGERVQPVHHHAHRLEHVIELVVEYRARVVATRMALTEDEDVEQVAAVTELRPLPRPLASVQDGE